MVQLLFSLPKGLFMQMLFEDSSIQNLLSNVIASKTTVKAVSYFIITKQSLGDSGAVIQPFFQEKTK
jgi:DNA-directed RNA polymerase subunit L